MFEIEFSPTAQKQFNKLERSVQTRIFSALERIRIRPAAHLTRLVGDPGYKLRVGDYRLIIDLDKGKLLVLVLNIGHRKNVYKKR